MRLHQMKSRGNIVLENKKYPMLSFPLDETKVAVINELLSKYKKIIYPKIHIYERVKANWLVLDNKLYLTSILVQVFENIKDTNILEDSCSVLENQNDKVYLNIFPEVCICNPNDLIFADWVNGTIKINAGRKVETNIKIEDRLEIFHEVHLEIRNGIIINQNNIQHKRKTLRCYIEE